VAGSKRRTKITWLADGPESNAHGFRRYRKQGPWGSNLAELAACGIPRVGGMRETIRNKCPQCLFILSRDFRG
jgi:hypothetical protein